MMMKNEFNKLKIIIKNFKGEEPKEKFFSDICYDSRKVSDNSVFFAIKGVSVDGHKFIENAYMNGAILVIGELDVKAPEGRYYWKVSDSNQAFIDTYLWYKKYPDREMDVIGITGTNGKTTITFLLEAIFKEANLFPGVIGTINYRYGEKVVLSENTTPSFGQIVDILSDMRDAGVKVVFMEVSSHGLKQGRVTGISFKGGIFTNLTRDHLDYHNTFEDYFLSKKLLFNKILDKSSKTDKFGVVNSDDDYGKEIIKEKYDYKLYSYGKTGEGLRIVNLRSDLNGLSLEFSFLGENYKVSSDIIGDFNGYNIAAAIETALLLDVKFDVVKAGIEKLKSVPGRMERVNNNKIVAIIDYAHTPDAIEKVLNTIHKLRIKGKLITVFGAGGDRDTGKRKLMGNVAGIYSDIIVVTSDNPRTEDPEHIIDMVIDGISGNKKVYREVDRRKAIKKAIKNANTGDVIVILGKGHEDYQIIGKKKYHFSDREVVEEYLEGVA